MMSEIFQLLVSIESWNCRVSRLIFTHACTAELCTTF